MVFDAEHFDGYKANKEYALETLEAAEKAGPTLWFFVIPMEVVFP